MSLKDPSMTEFRHFPSKSGQRGVALIYVLLIFSLITLMASQIVTNLWLHTEKNARYLERVQAKHYALGAEQYIALLLEQDFDLDKKNKRMVDHEKEYWNIQRVNYPVDQGDIEVRVVDEQSRFNLNWLAVGDKGEAETIEKSNETGKKSQYVEMLQNLLLTQALDPQMAFKIQDWVDSDNTASESGAEDDVYMALDPPRRTANAEMASVSELMLIQGIGLEELDKLLPLVTVLPKSSKINLNTALSEVIRSINKNISEGDALAILEGRGSKGIASMNELSNLPALNGKIAPFQGTPVGFSSRYFSAYIKATYRDTTFYLKTLLFRNPDGQVQVAGREIGPSVYWTPTKKES